MTDTTESLPITRGKALAAFVRQWDPMAWGKETPEGRDVAAIYAYLSSAALPADLADIQARYDMVRKAWREDGIHDSDGPVRDTAVNVTCEVADYVPALVAELTQAREALADCVPLTGFDYDDHERWEAALADYDDVEFFVHVTGPDDVHCARSWDEAAQLAHGLNTGAIRYLSKAAARGAEHPTRLWAIPMDRRQAVRAGLVDADSAKEA